MCGFLFAHDSKGSIGMDLFETALSLMTHRGPDDFGVKAIDDQRTLLGSRRLSIHDLSPAGHMPMSLPGGAIDISFNGEIYNYREIRAELQGMGLKFASDSDTEVALKAYFAWGVSCLEKFDGMFGFAIVDRSGRFFRNPTAVIARDRVGEKPVFYLQNDGRFVSASELRALLALMPSSRAADVTAIGGYLSLGYFVGDSTPVEGVKRLRPGTFGIFDLEQGSFETRSYLGSDRVQQPQRILQDAEAASNLLQLLRGSVEKRLQADVPVGILLSGGLDSSLVAAIAAEVSQSQVSTFTVEFPGYGKFDESSKARAIASHLGTNHHTLKVDSSWLNEIPELISSFDMPIGDSSIIPTIWVSRLARRHVTVALGGDGADELFGGYTSYGRSPQFPRLASSEVAKHAVNAIANVCPIAMRGRRRALAQFGSSFERFTRATQLNDVSAVRKIGHPELRTQLVEGAYLAESERNGAYQASGLDGVRAEMFADFKTYLPDDILCKVDQASMRHSLEVRAPWLAHGIVKFSHTQAATHQLVRGESRKWLLREIASQLLPTESMSLQKQGFSLPTALWSSAPWLQFTQDALASSDDSPFSRDAMSTLVRAAKRSARAAAFLYPLVVLQTWLLQHKVALR